MKVYFIGAGPGDPELITVKGRRIIEESDIIIYAGSLINPLVFSSAKQNAEIYDSASLHLEQISAVFKRAKEENKTVARLHAGDLSIYGAIQEQIKQLHDLGIDYEIVPGVGSLAASAAALKTELTAPEISQTVIMSRLRGRTDVPEKEKLSVLAEHRATLCLFLSVHLIDEVVAEILPAYGPDTPAAVVERASWPEERVIRGDLVDLPMLVKQAGIKKTALIIVGDVLSGNGSDSKLYDAKFTHGYRQAER